MSLALAEKMETAGHYFRLRAENPTAPALRLFNYLKDAGNGDTLQEYLCTGHEWAYSDTDRCYCVYCGKDGDG